VFDDFLSKTRAYPARQRSQLLNLFKLGLSNLLADYPAPPSGSPTGTSPVEGAKNTETKKEAPASAPAATPAPEKKEDAASAVTGGRHASTRVSKAPGGGSSIQLGGDDSAAGTPTAAGSHSSGRKLFTDRGQSQLAFGERGQAHTSVRTSAPPGGVSSVQFGGDEPAQKSGRKHIDRPSAPTNEESAPKTKRSHVHITQPAGGVSQIKFGESGSDGSLPSGRSSTRTSNPAGGKSSVVLGGPEKAVAAKDSKPTEEDETDLTSTLLTEIAQALQRKGSTKKTFTTMTGNKSKCLGVEDLKTGIQQLGFASFSGVQATALMTRFSSNVEQGLSFSDFVKILQHTGGTTPAAT